MGLKLTIELLRQVIRINKSFGTDLDAQLYMYLQSESYEMCTEIKKMEFLDKLALKLEPNNPWINGWEDLIDYLKDDTSKAVDFCAYSLESMLTMAFELKKELEPASGIITHNNEPKQH